MSMSYTSSKRMILICAVSIVLVDVLLALFVIPAVKTDSYPRATPEAAVPAFWVIVGLSLFLAAVCGSIAISSKERSRATTVSLVACGVFVMLLGLLLTDAASGCRSHGPSMEVTSNLLYICATVYCLAGLVVSLVAFLRPGRIK